MTTTALKEYTLKDLAQMAKKRGVLGWHSMRKNDLIRALVRADKQASKGAAKNGAKSRATGKNGVQARSGRSATRANGSAASSRRSTGRLDEGRAGSRQTATATARKSTDCKTPPTSVRSAAKTKSPDRRQMTAVGRKIRKAHREQEQFKDLSGSATPVAVPAQPRSRFDTSRKSPPLPVAAPGKDRVVLMVRDPYWLHVHWEISGRGIQRAQAAMAEYWHTANPVIRLMEVSSKGTTATTETFVRDIVIHGGVSNWYIDVVDPPKAYRVEIGYLASNNHFHGLARSNSVVTPEPGSNDAMDRTWVDVAENCERIFAMSGGYSDEAATNELQEVMEERLRRPVGAQLAARYGVGADPSLGKDTGFRLIVDAEMIVSGSTKPGAEVTLAGEPIKVRDDGSFSVRLSLPERRQILPVTSISGDGMTQQTVVLAIERNTKVMEVILRDPSQ